MMNQPRPTKADLLAAAGKALLDVISPDLNILFCGINPGLYSAAVGHHFARPGNRFWPALYVAGFTPRLLSCYEERELLSYGYGITNLVRRATASAGEITLTEYREGGRSLVDRLHKYRPRFLAILGIGAYRSAFDMPKAGFGRQDMRIEQVIVWVLPNPSGLNAHFTLQGLADHLRELKAASGPFGQ
jgi:TDG/mug DNA glycosylase family protein